MAFEWFDNRVGYRNAFVSIDRLKRMHVSSGTRDMLKVNKGEPISLYVGYDAETKQIGIAPVTDVKLSDTRPMKFDGSRYYSSANALIARYQLPADGSRYYYIGKDDKTGAYMFQLEGFGDGSESSEK